MVYGSPRSGRISPDSSLNDATLTHHPSRRNTGRKLGLWTFFFPNIAATSIPLNWFGSFVNVVCYIDK